MSKLRIERVSEFEISNNLKAAYDGLHIETCPVPAEPSARLQSRQELLEPPTATFNVGDKPEPAVIKDRIQELLLHYRLEADKLSDGGFEDNNLAIPIRMNNLGIES